MIKPDYSRANVQILMRDGDNQAMQRVVDVTEAHLKEQPLPPGIRTAWAGETYLNLVWQDKMVSGMLKAFISTFGVVLVLVILLFRSLRWGLVAMLPMSATVLFVYGALGFAGKDYDMPLAVLSTLVLGISIDFAIHFLIRYREQMKETLMTSGRALSRVFEEPARAIARNALIVVLGFVPMFFSSLVPYVVVGMLMVAIMVLSFFGVSTAVASGHHALPKGRGNGARSGNFLTRGRDSAPYSHPSLTPSLEAANIAVSLQ